jgi:hypothetical protein
MKKLVVMLFASMIANAGCNFNLDVKNVSDSKLEIHNSNFNIGSASKVKGTGIWISLADGGWMTYSTQHGRFSLNPNETLGDRYKTKLGCGTKRQYRIFYTCPGHGSDTTYVSYYPSANTWTEDRIDIVIPVGQQCKR